jgi:hypothetical protein
MLSRLLLNAAVAEVNADTAADADGAVDAASAAEASALALSVTPDGANPGRGLIIMAWVIALLAPLIALILVVLVGIAAFCRDMAGGLIGNIGTEG